PVGGLGADDGVRDAVAVHVSRRHRDLAAVAGERIDRPEARRLIDGAEQLEGGVRGAVVEGDDDVRIECGGRVAALERFQSWAGTSGRAAGGGSGRVPQTSEPSEHWRRSSRREGCWPAWPSRFPVP